MKCSQKSCPNMAVSEIWGQFYCFDHEREMVERYGYGATSPIALATWRLSPEAAAEFLRRVH